MRLLLTYPVEGRMCTQKIPKQCLEYRHNISMTFVEIIVQCVSMNAVSSLNVVCIFHPMAKYSKQ